MSQLWVVMPVYNESGSLRPVVSEWIDELRRQGIDFTFCALDDGSTDDSAEILEQLNEQYRKLDVVKKQNSGHGQTCLLGYQRALAAGATCILQIDSDGQCDPSYFSSFWKRRHRHRAIYGFRRTRDDGRLRRLISRVTTFAVYASTGVWVRDANVPYRLMSSGELQEAMQRVPPDADLANIFVAIAQANRGEIRWLDIGFCRRVAGKPKLNLASIAKKGYRLVRQLRTSRRLLLCKSAA